jgi:beta-galactosidase
MGTFGAIGGGFVRDGREQRVLSGALHYFRVRPEQWEHRLRMLRAMGLNTVETYVPWNLHEPRPGTLVRLEELADFLDLAGHLGLDAIVRPGPYICAEWDNGGLPSWLTGSIAPAGFGLGGVGVPVRGIRCADSGYLAAVDAWFDVLIPLIAQRQVTRGGNVIMVQVENEYGSYGSDAGYLRHLADGLVRRGIEVPLFTSDGPTDRMLTNGTVPGVLATVNFGSEPEAAFKTFRAHRESDPLFCMEFWCGWFDHWGGEHVTRDPADAADTLARILEAGASVNIYMAHGGTNFGTWAGANRAGEDHRGELKADVTSYDYDAPIDERGAPTEKFWLFREVLASYGTPDELPELPQMLEPGPVELPEALRLFAFLDQREPVRAPMPLTFEELGLSHGLVLYRTGAKGDITIDGLADRVQVFGGDLLVESMGRVNYGPRVGEPKGITGAVRQGQYVVHGFEMYPFDVNDIGGLPWGTTGSDGGPVFTRGHIDVDEPRDAYVEVGGSGGYLWVNGFLLGRYSTAGPQRRLYVPWPVLRQGRNEIVVLDLETEVTSVDMCTEAMPPNTRRSG